MIHPLHPDSPQYAQLKEAGRVPERFGTVDRDPLACSHESEDKYGRTTCGEPATNQLARSDGLGVTFRVCDADLVHYSGGVPFSDGVTFVVARVSCSSCDDDAQRYQLDASGRCDGCRP